MTIENIKEVLRQKAQSLNVTPMPLTAPVQEQVSSSTTARPRQNAQPTQTESPSVVVPLNAPQAPAPVPIPVAPVAEQKPTRKAPVRNSRAKAKSGAPLSDIEAIIAEHLRAGIDYTTLPKCGNKPVLLKGGAEHLASIFGFRTKSEIVHREFLPDTKFLMYEVSTTVYNSEGDIIAVGLGSANTLETRYIKQGLAMSANTVLKMSRKRSYVDAILSASSVSRIFTQDIEELVSLSEDYQDRREE